MNSFTKADIFLSVFVQNLRTLNGASTRYSPMGYISISKYHSQYSSLSTFTSVRAALESMIQDNFHIRKIRERAVLKKCQGIWVMLEIIGKISGKLFVFVSSICF